MLNFYINTRIGVVAHTANHAVSGGNNRGADRSGEISTVIRANAACHRVAAVGIKVRANTVFTVGGEAPKGARGKDMAIIIVILAVITQESGHYFHSIVNAYA